jgi:hypothetical protein
MDWTAVIERNGAALRRVVGVLVAMFGPDTGAELRAPGASAADRPTLARHRHRALLRVLRPAEAAARRLIIVVALAFAAPAAPAADEASVEADAPQGRPRRALAPRQPEPSPSYVKDGAGTGIVRVRLYGGHPSFGVAVGPPAAVEAVDPPLRALRLPLADPVRRQRRRRARRLPRISVDSIRPPQRRPPQPDDRLDATRLVFRVEALAAALADLPAEARRFLRWRERRATMLAREAEAEVRRGRDPARGGDDAAVARTWRAIIRQRRATPLRLGRPPGWRRKPVHEVEAILAELHALAVRLPHRIDTS